MAAHLNRRSVLSWALAAPLAATAACTGPASAAPPSGTPRAGQATTEPPSRARPGSLGVGALTYNIMTSRKRRIDRMPEEALDDLVWENRIDTVAAKIVRAATGLDRVTRRALRAVNASSSVAAGLA